MVRKDVILAILATFCLTVTLFMVLPTKSSPSAGEYNPWGDIDDNGKIDIKDVSTVARMFGATGDPTKNVDVTNWPPSFCSASRRVNISWVDYGSSHGIAPDWPSFNASGYSRMSVQLAIVDWDPHPTNSSYVTTVSIDSAFWCIDPVAGFGDSKAPLAASVAVLFPMQVPAYLPTAITLKTTEIIAPHFFVFFTIARASDLEQGSVLVDVYAYLRNE